MIIFFSLCLIYFTPNPTNMLLRVHSHVSLFKRECWASKAIYRGSAADFLALQGFCANPGIPPQMPQKGDFFFLFSFISLIADGHHHYHPACGHKGSSHLSPVHALQFFYRDASSALLQLVNQWLNFTYSRSHAFRYERKNTNPTLVRIELTTSVLADVQLTY